MLSGTTDDPLALRYPELAEEYCPELTDPDASRALLGPGLEEVEAEMRRMLQLAVGRTPSQRRQLLEVLCFRRHLLLRLIERPWTVTGDEVVDVGLEPLATRIRSAGDAL